MARITAEQINSINSKCSNNWKLNVRHYLNYREKTLLKNIEIDNKTYLQFSLQYNSIKQIILRISRFEYLGNDTGLAVSEGLGKRKILNPIEHGRKDINKLIEFTKKLTDEELIRIDKDTEVTNNLLFKI